MRKRDIFFIFSLFSLFISMIIYCPIVNASENTWTIMEAIPTPRSYCGISAINEKIYVLGGDDGGLNAIGTNEEYDVNTDTWTFKNPMPTPRMNFATAVFQNRIYTFGGVDGDSGSDLSSVVEVYDPSTDSWENKTSMPTPKAHFHANVINDKIFLISGLTQSAPGGSLYLTSENIVYDLLTDSWDTKTSIPIATHSHVSVTVDDKIYIIGGASGSQTQIYDPQSDSWNIGESIPTNVQNAAGVATTGNLAPKAIYVFGGFIEFLWSTNLTQIYCPENNTWSLGANIPTGRYGLAATEMDDMLFLMGGMISQYSPPTDLNHKYIPIGYIPEFSLWIILPIILTITLTSVILRKKINN